MTTKTLGSEFEEDVMDEDLHPQGYQTTNAEFRSDNVVSDMPETMVLSCYPQHHSQTRLFVYPGEICFRTESEKSNLEVAMDPNRKVEDDRLFVQSTVNGCPALIERRYTKKEMLLKLRAELRVEAMHQLSRLLYSTDAYHEILKVSVDNVKNPLPDWKVSCEVLPFENDIGEVDPVYGTYQDAWTAIYNLCGDEGAFIESIKDLQQGKKDMLDNADEFFSNEFPEGEVDKCYYTQTIPKDKLVGFAYFDYLLRTNIPDNFNPNVIKPPVLVSHGLKITEYLCDDRVAQPGDMVFSVPPEMNEDGDFNIHTPNDPGRYVREIRTLPFDEFMRLRAMAHMKFEASGERYGESIPYQYTYDGKRIYGDLAAYYNPDRFEPISRTFQGLIFDADGIVLAQDVPAGKISTATEMRIAPNIPEDNYSVENFIGEALSGPNTHGKILVDYAIHF